MQDDDSERTAPEASDRPVWRTDAQRPKSRIHGGPMGLGLPGRVLMTLPVVVPLVYGWIDIVLHWGSARMLFDWMWVPPVTVAAYVWLRHVWEATPYDDQRIR